MLFQQIRTRLLILSDTHGHALPDPDDNTTTTQIIRSGFCRPLPPADVALHCGDLTLRSTPAELETTLDLMREVDAPLKLVIPGNHDSSLDMVFWEREVCDVFIFFSLSFVQNQNQQNKQTNEKKKTHK